MEAGAFVVGFLVTQTLGQGVRYMLDHLQLESISSPSGIEQKKWEAALTSENRKIGGRWVGHLERFAFFASFWFLPSDAHLLVGGWLTFKLAAKWESWRNVVRVPEKFTEQPNILDELRARNEWGTITLSRFLIGTLGNVLSGFFGAKAGPKVVEGLKMATYDSGWEILFRRGTGLIVTLLIGGYLTGRFIQKLRDFLTKQLARKIKELQEHEEAKNQKTSKAIEELKTSLQAFKDFPDQPEIPPRLTGFIEQLFFIIIVAFEVQGAAIAMIGWATVKMATGWNWQPSNENRLAALSGLLGTVVSLGFALLGGLICSKKIWWWSEVPTNYHWRTFAVALIFGLFCAAK